MSNPEIEIRYRRYISKHPWVLDAFVERAKTLASQGALRLSAKHIVEALRAEYKPRPGANEKFGISNSYATSLAKDAIRLAPELAGLFELRALRSRAARDEAMAEYHAAEQRELERIMAQYVEYERDHERVEDCGSRVFVNAQIAAM